MQFLSAGIVPRTDVADVAWADQNVASGKIEFKFMCLQTKTQKSSFISVEESFWFATLNLMIKYSNAFEEEHCQTNYLIANEGI